MLPFGQMSLWGGLNTFNFSNLNMLLLPRILKHKFYRQLSTNSIHNNDSSLYPFYIKNINKLLEIFIGLIDGVGYIEIGSQKQYSKFSNSKYQPPCNSLPCF